MGPQNDHGWISGSMGTSNTMEAGAFTTPHYVFPRTEKNTALDGSPMDVHSLVRQQAKSECHFCGAPIINTDWPTGSWRHQTKEEIAKYETEQQRQD